MFLLWWVASAYWVLVLFAVVFGVCYGAYVALLPTIVMDLYGPRSVSGIIGCLYTGCGIGTLLGPWLAGVAYDAVGSYQLPILAGAAFSVGAAACVADPGAWGKPKPSIAVSDVARRAHAARRRRGDPELDAARGSVRARARLHALHDGVPAVPSRAARGADDRPGRRLARQVLSSSTSARPRSAWSSSMRACSPRRASISHAAAGRRALPRRDRRRRRRALSGMLRHAGDRRVRGRAARAEARERRVLRRRVPRAARAGRDGGELHERRSEVRR